MTEPLAKDDADAVGVSVLTGEGLEALKNQILSAVGLIAGLQPEMVPNLRQQTALEEALARVREARQALIDLWPPDIAALEIAAAVESFNHITGRVYTDDILARIFDKFCVGK